MNQVSIIGALNAAAPPMKRRCSVGIGGVSLGLSVDLSEGAILPPEHQPFETNADSCDIEVQCRWVDRLSPAPGKKLFDSGAVWSLFSAWPGFAFDFASPRFGEVPYKRLLTNSDFSRAELLLNRAVISSMESFCLLEYPLDELLVTHWLAPSRGVEIHGCGILDADVGGVLFVGHSGAGKSTTVSLWNTLRNVHVLSDDRIILRKEHGRLLMYGTPWHGEAGFASPVSAPLRAIFVLEHGEGNQISLFPPPRAVAELFARCFLPFHDPAKLRSALDFLHEITALAPCYRYRFSPDAGAVERILDFLRSR